MSWKGLGYLKLSGLLFIKDIQYENGMYAIQIQLYKTMDINLKYKIFTTTCTIYKEQKNKMLKFIRIHENMTCVKHTYITFIYKIDSRLWRGDPIFMG